MLGPLLALASAACFGLNNAALRRGVLTGGVLQAMAITVPLGVPFFLLACALFGGFDSLADFSLPSWAWLTLAGVVHFVIGRYGNYRTTRALGATLSGPIHQLSVPIALVLALLFLDEVLTPLRLAGFLLVMTGPLVAVRGSNKRKQKQKTEHFEPHVGEGMVWGTVCALGYGSSPLFIVKGLGPERSIVDSLAAGLVSYSAAAIVVLVLVAIAGGAAYMRSLDRTARNWFAASGFFVFLSQMFRYMALAVAPVTVVVPIQRLSVVFRVIFSWLINRDHEVITGQVLLGIAISLLGALALTLSTDIVAAVLPESMAWLVTLSWPAP
ncbi:MAG: DMT family transporter [Gammaproteobacteria bacterium]|nr:DMT family transporter [Gammaproteobacteria bacterium]